MPKDRKRLSNKAKQVVSGKLTAITSPIRSCRQTGKRSHTNSYKKKSKIKTRTQSSSKTL